MTVADPTMRFERALQREGARYVIGCDEVGRGAIAGPIGVGVCVIDAGVRRKPQGLRDSKLLSEKRREELFPKAASWGVFNAVGTATNDEVDRLGLTAALGLAGARAVSAVAEAGISLEECVVLLDGHWDWLNPPQPHPEKRRPPLKAHPD